MIYITDFALYDLALTMVNKSPIENKVCVWLIVNIWYKIYFKEEI